MKRRKTRFTHVAPGIILLLAAWPVFAADLFEKELPENVARAAKVTASDEYSNQYGAANVVDGEIPSAGSRADVDSAWCVRGKTVGDRAELTLSWDQPVEIGRG